MTLCSPSASHAWPTGQLPTEQMRVRREEFLPVVSQVKSLCTNVVTVTGFYIV